MASAPPRYTTVAILLHWLIAIGILAMLAMGLAMVHAPLPVVWKFRIYQWHKSVGITILLLALLRLGWRLLHHPPALPATMPRWERRAAEASHGLLYGLMIGMPLLGWAVVSASPLNIPTVLYGLWTWPHLPFFPTAAIKAWAEPLLVLLHGWGGYLLVGLVLLHAGAAFRHHVLKADDVLRRMLPGLPGPRQPLGEKP